MEDPGSGFIIKDELLLFANLDNYNTMCERLSTEDYEYDLTCDSVSASESSEVECAIETLDCLTGCGPGENTLESVVLDDQETVVMYSSDDSGMMLEIVDSMSMCITSLDEARCLSTCSETQLEDTKYRHCDLSTSNVVCICQNRTLCEVNGVVLSEISLEEVEYGVVVMSNDKPIFSASVSITVFRLECDRRLDNGTNDCACMHAVDSIRGLGESLYMYSRSMCCITSSGEEFSEKLCSMDGVVIEGTVDCLSLVQLSCAAGIHGLAMSHCQRTGSLSDRVQTFRRVGVG